MQGERIWDLEHGMAFPTAGSFHLEKQEGGGMRQTLAGAKMRQEFMDVSLPILKHFLG